MQDCNSCEFIKYSINYFQENVLSFFFCCKINLIKTNQILNLTTYKYTNTGLDLKKTYIHTGMQQTIFLACSTSWLNFHNILSHHGD